MEIRRHFLLNFHEFSGRKAWLLPARTFGPRCTCWDAARQKRTRSGCLTCYDTGFLRGYLLPIEIAVEIGSTTNSNRISNVGAQPVNNVSAKMGYYPAVKPDDLIIEPENRRWKVVAVSPIEHLRSPVWQMLSLHEIPPQDVEFQITLKHEEALKDMVFEAPRNYTNPHNLETGDGDLPDFLRIYRVR